MYRLALIEPLHLCSTAFTASTTTTCVCAWAIEKGARSRHLILHITEIWVKWGFADKISYRMYPVVCSICVLYRRNGTWRIPHTLGEANHLHHNHQDHHPPIVFYVFVCRTEGNSVCKTSRPSELAFLTASRTLANYLHSPRGTSTQIQAYTCSAPIGLRN